MPYYHRNFLLSTFIFHWNTLRSQLIIKSYSSQRRSSMNCFPLLKSSIVLSPVTSAVSCWASFTVLLMKFEVISFLISAVLTWSYLHGTKLGFLRGILLEKRAATIHTISNKVLTTKKWESRDSITSSQTCASPSWKHFILYSVVNECYFCFISPLLLSKWTLRTSSLIRSLSVWVVQ